VGERTAENIKIQIGSAYPFDEPRKMDIKGRDLVDGIPKAYPLGSLVEETVVNDTIGDTNVVLVAARGRVTVNGESLQAGEVTYDAGGEVRAFERGQETFTPGPTPDTVVDSQGQVWQVTEDALLSPDGMLAPRLSGHLAYWFGWFAFFPNTLIYEGPINQ